MKKLLLALCSAAVLFLTPLYAADRPAYDYLAGLSDLPAVAAPLPAAPAAVAVPERYEKPPCVPSQAIQPGRGFVPKVNDALRERAIAELLSRISVCRPMPYNNDGNVHSKPHSGLPAKPSGYYLEYTLIIPGRETGEGPEPVNIGGVTYMTGAVLSHRGAERLMIGGGREVFYTPDHYTTFIRLSIVR